MEGGQNTSARRGTMKSMREAEAGTATERHE